MSVEYKGIKYKDNTFTICLHVDVLPRLKPWDSLYFKRTPDLVRSVSQIRPDYTAVAFGSTASRFAVCY